MFSGLTHIFHLPSILGMVSSIVQHALGCDCPCWPKPRWCSGRRLGQHELLTTNGKNMGVSDQPWGLNLPKWQTLKWWIHWDAISASSKRTEATRICPSLLPGGALGLRHWAKAPSWPTSSEMLSRFDMYLKWHQR